ncbi:hypothetical protein FB451DRAFT_1363390 [Mycena latifolia]|nr:hypothetical protein FB451DRAFT_1363390 [Mycena latifolia]
MSLLDALEHLNEIEETLENITSNSPNTHSLKLQLRTRLDRVLSRLPVAPVRQIPSQRASSEPPNPAQPSPCSPPKPKLTKKEEKTLRCKARAKLLMSESLDADLLTSDDFFHDLLHPFRGKLVEEEDRAMAKLTRGYFTGTLDSWRASRGPVDFSSVSIQGCLKQELEYVKVKDLTQRILLRHRNLSFQETSSDVSNFLRVLFQTVNAIEFSIEVKQLGTGSGGTRRKTALYQSMYDADGGSCSYEEWKVSNEAKVTARNRLTDVWDAFGPIMLFDSFWSPRNMEPNHRSNDFGETVKELIKAIPVYNAQTGVGPLSRYLSSTHNALCNLLNLVFPSATDHVLEFCVRHPPAIVLDDDSDNESEA